MSDPESALFLLTGPPGSGKTTLLRELVDRGFRTVAEPARIILGQQRASDGRGVPDRDPALFCSLMLARALEDYRDNSSSRGPVFFDRGIPDTIGYARLFGIDESRFVEAASQFRYAPTVFVTPPWESIYATDNERTIDFRAAAEFGDRILAAYREMGYTLIEIPPLIPVDRAEFILSTIEVLARKR